MKRSRAVTRQAPPRFGIFEERYASRESARIAILPVPYDGTSTWIKGADRGPAALLSASLALELYDIETGGEVYRLGIHTAPAVRESRSPERMIRSVRARADALLADGKFVVTIGGEHSVSVGAIAAHAARHPGLSVLQLDAHSDLRDEFRGSRYNHGCVMARARELCPVVQVGIRSMDGEEKARMRPGSVFFAQDLQGDDRWMAQVIRRLARDVYLTVDLDAFDPSIMPSTGTPEPGGLLWYPVLRLLRRVFRERHVVGFDLVELCPSEHNRGPDFLAAKLLYTLLSYKFCDAPARRLRKDP
jgi:agmatinase